MNNSLNKRCSSAISTVTYASTNASANDGGTQLPFLIGTPELHAQRQFDRRDKDQILTYEPTAGWTKPPARAWIPELNRDVLVGFILWNAVVAILARFTGMCGVPPPDAPSYVLCGDSDEWVMGEVAVYNTLGVGMFLLLTFRAHEGYGRFWEGRKAWGRVRECCRDLTRQICYAIEVGEHYNHQEAWMERRRAVGFVGAFASTLKLTLRGERNPVPELGQTLCFQDILNIEKARSMPLFCLDVLSYYLNKMQRQKRLGEISVATINATCISPLNDAYGTCERIRNQPIPLSYSLHLRFILLLWLLLYPLHLVSFYGWFSIVLAGLIDLAVLGIESMACEIENPFLYHKNCIDLCSFCKGIVADTQEILARAEHRDAELVLDGAEVRKMNDRLFEEASKDPTNMQHLEDMADPEKNFFRKDRGAGWWSCNAFTRNENYNAP